MIKYILTLFLLGPLVLLAQNDDSEITAYKNRIRACQQSTDLENCQKIYQEYLDYLKEHVAVIDYLEAKIRKLYFFDKTPAEEIASKILPELKSSLEGEERKAALGLVYNYLSSMSYFQEKYELARKFGHQCIEYVESMESPDYQRLVEMAHTLSNIYVWSFGNIREGLKYGKLSLKYAEKAFGRKHVKNLHAVGNVAVIYAFMGANNEAMDYYKRGIDIAETMSQTPETKVLLSRYYVNMGGMLFGKGKLDASYAMYEKALELQKSIENWGEVAVVYNTMAHTFIEKGAPEKAKELFNKALELIDQNQDPAQRNYNKSEIFTGLGTIAIESNNLKEGLVYFDKAVALYKGDENISRSAELSNIYLLLANKIKDQNPDTALVLVRNALVSSSPTLQYKDLSISIEQEIEDHQFFNTRQSLFMFVEYAELLLGRYEETKNAEELNLALSFVKAGIKLGNRASNGYSNAKDKLNLMDGMYYAYNVGMKTVYKLYTLEDNHKHLSTAFTFAESNKSILLQQTLQRGQALRIGEVPDSLVDKEQEFKLKLSKLEDERIAAIARNDKDTEVALNESVFQLKEQLKLLNATIEKNFPKYFDLKYNADFITVDALKKNILKDKQGLLEFFIGREAIYLFFFTKDGSLVFKRLEKPAKLEEHIRDFREGLANFNLLKKNSQKSYELFTKEAAWFYNYLLADVLKDKDLNRLIIIPDGLLGHLPFEVLLQNPAPAELSNFSNLDYLLKDYAISYAYSSTLLAQNSNLNQQAQKGILGIAADYSNDASASENTPTRFGDLRDLLKDLPAARQEVQMLAQHFSGNYWFDLEASELNFKQQAADYAIIHLAMHGLLNSDNPMSSSLVFTEDGDSTEDDFLHAYELTQMNLNANLVVLSACETGYGKFEQGEGVLSLARAFMYSGVPSLVVSLWQVNDESTATLMEYFYEKLAQGQPKDEALRQAKLKYLEQADALAGHPAFWAAFIQLGNTEPVRLASKQGSWIWWVGGGLVLFILLLIIRKIITKK